MKAEYKNLTPIKLALLTWYKPNNPKYKDPLHPTLELAGSIGKLLYLYQKHLFKPGFDWMDCKHCKTQPGKHYFGEQEVFCDRCQCGDYTPKAIDELGDIWYYLRILAWQSNVELYLQYAHEADILQLIKQMYYYGHCVINEDDWIDGMEEYLQEIYEHLLLLLEKLGHTIDQLTELNYKKLNSEPTNHGWLKAK